MTIAAESRSGQEPSLNDLNGLNYLNSFNFRLATQAAEVRNRDLFEAGDDRIGFLQELWRV